MSEHSLTRYDQSVGDDLKHAVVKFLDIRGIIAVLLGIALLVAPGIGADVVGFLVAFSIAVFLLVDGVSTIQFSRVERTFGVPGAVWPLILGILEIVLAVVCVIYPFETAAAGTTVLMWMFVIGLLLAGIFEVLNPFNTGWGTVGGILDIVLAIFLGVLLAANPGEVLESFVWVGGLLSLIAGIFVLVAAYRVRKAVVI